MSASAESREPGTENGDALVCPQCGGSLAAARAIDARRRYCSKPCANRARAGETRAPHRVRRDALPEHMEWRDTGCEVSPLCQECPLPVCRYEMPGGLHGLQLADLTRRVVELRESGLTVDEVGAAVGLSRRSVFRHQSVARRSA